MSQLSFAQLAAGSGSTASDYAGAYLKLFACLPAEAQALVRDVLGVKHVTQADVDNALTCMRTHWGDAAVSNAEAITDQFLPMLPADLQDALLVWRRRAEVAGITAAPAVKTAAPAAANTAAPAAAVTETRKSVVGNDVFTRFPQTKAARSEWFTAAQSAGYTQAVWPNGSKTPIAGFTSLNAIAKAIEAVRNPNGGESINNKKFATDAAGQIVYLADAQTVVRLVK